MLLFTRLHRILPLFLILVLVGAASDASAAPAGDIARTMSVFWITPFALMLLSLATIPLFAPHFWEHHYGKVAGFLSFCLLIPLTIAYGFTFSAQAALSTILHEYIPFIVLLTTLFTIAGGIRVATQLNGTPKVNLGILVVGAGLASFMGTTGAAMLFIRPILRANAHRKYAVHTMVFFIFMVANVGGSLTPLGDPPLFLGFLQGVSFFWSTQYMLLPMVITLSILAVVYFALDSYLYSREGRPQPKIDPNMAQGKLVLEGKINFILLFGVILAVLLSGIVHTGITFSLGGVELHFEGVARDIILLGLTALSLKLTPRSVREANDFDWEPMKEVGKLFFGIFITMIPAIMILNAGTAGGLSSIVQMVSDSNGAPNNGMYFWITGGLSSFLDNAPTYLVFLAMAGDSAVEVSTQLPTTLLAISCGAVFMGANTYIGNAPNFMVRAIAEASGVKMPSFFGYIGWSLLFLVPIFILLTFLFF